MWSDNFKGRNYRMKNKYQYNMCYMNPCYMKQIKSIYPVQNIYKSQNINMFEISNNYGFIRISVIDQMTGEPITNLGITIYVTDGAQRDIPVLHLVTTPNPIRIELPVACSFGTQIKGPEYDFSTYNLRVDVFGYFANVVYNIRLFPDTTTDFQIAMTPITQVRLEPVIEERVDIPPHPRDEVINAPPSN
jgi:5-hydroxyisourate hydrolase-like protein (transthyretin family)